MNIEPMAGYPGNLRIMRTLEDVNISQLQSQISTFTKKIQDLTLPKVGRPQFWCTSCYTEGHVVNECLRLRGMGPSNMVPLLAGTIRGVSQFFLQHHFMGLFNIMPF